MGGAWIMEETRMTINEYQELAMTTLNPELSKRDDINK